MEGENMRKKTPTIPEGKLCDNGCGQLAKWWIPLSDAPGPNKRNPKWCCCKHSLACPAAKEVALRKRRETSLAKYGTENYQALPQTREKFKQTCQEHFGAEAPMLSKEISAKRVETNLARYGNAGAMSPETVAKRDKTVLARHGVVNVGQLEGVKEKARDTCQIEYGSNFWQSSEVGRAQISDAHKSPELQARRRRTCLRRYGIPHQMTEAAKEKQRITSMQHFGVTHHFKSRTWFYSHLFKTKEYIFPSGRTVQVQGFEPKALDRLLALGVPEMNIVVGIEVPTVIYTVDEKSHTYYPDILVRGLGLVEVKSEYTFNKMLGINTRKHRAAIAQGHHHELWIYSDDGSSLRILDRV
jgi:hypothetical protein